MQTEVFSREFLLHSKTEKAREVKAYMTKVTYGDRNDLKSYIDTMAFSGEIMALDGLIDRYEQLPLKERIYKVV